MLTRIYAGLQKLPRFRGRARLEGLLRKRLKPPLFNVLGLQLQLDPQEWLQIEMMTGHPTEPVTLDLFGRLLRKGDIVVDVGAHIGLHALFAARAVGPLGRVVAIEPQPYNCERLMVNASANSIGNILTLCAAAGAIPSRVKLHQQAASDKARLTLAGKGVNDLGLCFEVPIVTLDEVCRREDIASIRILKIDVEGFECEVFAGGLEAISDPKTSSWRCSPMLIQYGLPDS